MLIGFDAKRIFNNTTGLGSYGRTLLHCLAEDFPDHGYYLFTPRTSSLFQASRSEPIKIIQPIHGFDRTFSSAWRSKFMAHDIKQLNVDIYHGLSNEIPFGIHHLGIKTVVTIHDLIFERYPYLYNPIDVRIYRKKVRYACKRAHLIIAVSQQTRRDLITYYQVDAGKIQVVYPGCDPAFSHPVRPEMLQAVQRLYGLPAKFLLYVGAVIERKNLLCLVKAMAKVPGTLPLVVIGYGKQYKNKVKKYVSDHGMNDKVIWLCDKQGISQAHLPALYRLAKVLIYPSIFEGFGIPIQEALWCETPVITSKGSCFGETGGDAVIYVSPFDTSELAEAIQKVCNDDYVAEDMTRKGSAYIQQFQYENTTRKIMNIYHDLHP